MAAAVMAIGTVVSAFGQWKQSDIAKKQEKMRQRQMNLEADRRKREIIREGQRARAMALNNATAQGAAEGSGLQGGYGQIAGQTNNSLLAINQDQSIGNRMFSLAGKYANWGTVSSIGQGVTQLGGIWSDQQKKAAGAK